MDAAQLIAQADAMRAYALDRGLDLNAANLFTHRMLVQKLVAEQTDEPLEPPPEPAPSH